MDNTAGKGVIGSFSSGDFFLIGAVVAWGVNFPFAKYTLSFMDPVVFSATRYVAAAALLFLFLKIRGVNLVPLRREIPHLILIGLFGVTLFQGGWAYGLNLTSASKASVLITTSPIFGALISAFRGNRPGWKAWAGIFLAFFGVAVVINNSLTEITLGEGRIAGDLLIIGASFMWALYTFVSESIVARRGPIFVTAWAMLFGAIILGLAGAPFLAAADWGAIPVTGWLCWAFTAVFGAALAFVWYVAGIARLGITRGMVYSFFIPVVAILSAVIALGEVITPVQIFGAVIVVAGVKLTRSG